ncbi:MULTISPECIES: histidine phosphatase family protein [Acinetobacter]|uniref:histidine phosphatase family protein n=1 Tax=Acinetobacter TaxID=469 RepID=UPI0014368B0D|nr:MULTISPECIES: histidine phosphatase family protein [Acinetobacter]MCA4815139.1 histidine phosphatase family protein [Acinetobacter towneri]MDM1736990.1 histidine phosphatase family protein [Acinetobacter towneri]QIV92339.1 histidine phosphatase family protein [Acinetobacter towneri]QTD63317.1 histidine phosphatase family protein [Acinetobacter towneri]UNT65583.1 histidine phosphatase family protein [Acinetobacter towneri]
MALELLPASMLKAIDLLPDAQTPVTLFTRHSIREIVVGQGLAGYNLQLTEQGRDLAEAWGGYLVGNTDRVIQHCISSPIQRCVDTAALMIRGADGITLEPNTHHIEIREQGLLVEPGSFVLDIKQAGPYFQKQGALGFINSFVNNALPGMKHPIHGVVDVLELIYNTHPTNQYGLSLAVSHDTILAAIIAVISGRNEVTQADWPDMMEGLFVWFEGDEFLESKLKWIWRGQIHTLDISQFRQKV